MFVDYEGRCFIARHEACVLVPYKDGKHFSIGYGHNDPLLSAKSPTISFEQAWAMLKEDVIPRAAIVQKWLKVPVQQYEFNALVSGYYQAGKKMKEVVQLINVGDRGEAKALWMSYNRDQGVFSDGLNERRNQERHLFTKGDYGKSAKPARLLWLWRGDPRTTKREEVPFPLEEAA